MSELRAITGILSQVDEVTEDFVFSGYQRLVELIQPEVTTIVVLYVMLLGIAIMHGWTEISVGQATKHILKISIIILLATNWDIFSRFFYDVFTNAPNEMALTLLKSIGNNDYFGKTSVNEALEVVFDKGMWLAMGIWSRGSFHAIGFYLVSIAVMVVVMTIATYVLLEFIAAKFGLAILLVLAPVFIMFALWQNLQGMFDNWLRYVIGFALIPIFITSVLLLNLVLLESAISIAAKAVVTNSFSIFSVMPFLLAGIVSIGLISKVAGIAILIAGGLSINTLALSQGFFGAGVLRGAGTRLIGGGTKNRTQNERSQTVSPPPKTTINKASTHAKYQKI